VSAHSNRFALYLKARRSQLKPEDAGFPADPGRRLPGLRRSEVAELAGISPEYYTRLEQGRAYQLSDQVLAGLTRALQLDESAAAYFYRLALPEPPVREVRPAPVISDTVLRLVEQWADVPVFLYDRNQDILMTNELASELFPMVVPGSNSVMTVFEMPVELRENAQWQRLARSTVAALRFHGDPSDPRLQQIVGELSIREPLFRAFWADYDAAPLTSGVVPAYVAGFGIVDFPWQNLHAPGGLLLGVWPAPPGTAAFAVLQRLRAGLRRRDRVVDAATGGAVAS
jgi:transcriptional regulator with XRE-family HTH domain